MAPRPAVPARSPGKAGSGERAEILAAVDQAEASFARGEGRRIAPSEGTAQLADEVKRRGLSRLAAEENNR